ncbi:hypothetical protein Taro_049474 [Colocasia esculenta]|uniref:Uncharacterized protein n=1 Tax=Colocasia esculenta TaxID=4460 RepID=A0A843XB17_COLES|nr:hypothetical protein [Colocasia esculenta]
MVRGGRSRTVSTSVGRGSTSSSTIGTASPSTPVVPATDLTYIQFCRDCLPVHAGRPDDRDRLPIDHSSSATFPFFLTTSYIQHLVADEEGPQLPGRQPCWILGGKIDPSSASRYITTLIHTHIPGPVDAWRKFPVPIWDLLFDMFTRRYTFTRPEDLPRARLVWESTA